MTYFSVNSAIIFKVFEIVFDVLNTDVNRMLDLFRIETRPQFTTLYSNKHGYRDGWAQKLSSPDVVNLSHKQFVRDM